MGCGESVTAEPLWVVTDDNLYESCEREKKDFIEIVKFSERFTRERILLEFLSGATRLREVYCPNSVRVIEPRAFEGCVALERFVLNEESLLSTIGKSAFKAHMCDQRVCF